MKLNFSLKQAYDDLFKTEGALKAFFLLIVISLFSKIPLLSIIIPVVISGTYVLIAHNVIQCVNPVVPKYSWFNKSIFISGFKGSMIGLIYGSVFYLFSLSLIFIIKITSLRHDQIYFLVHNQIFLIVTSFLLILLLTFYVYIIMLVPNTIFSENISFRQGFDVLKLLKTHKYAGKEYILVSVFFIVSVSILLGLGMLSSFLSGGNRITFYINLLFSVPIVYLITYFSVHTLAQSYKYALSQMESNRLISEENS